MQTVHDFKQPDIVSFSDRLITVSVSQHTLIYLSIFLILVLAQAIFVYSESCIWHAGCLFQKSICTVLITSVQLPSVLFDLVSNT